LDFNILGRPLNFFPESPGIKSRYFRRHETWFGIHAVSVVIGYVASNYMSGLLEHSQMRSILISDDMRVRMQTHPPLRDAFLSLAMMSSGHCSKLGFPATAMAGLNRLSPNAIAEGSPSARHV
jgi:hypothetical protein